MKKKVKNSIALHKASIKELVLGKGRRIFLLKQITKEQIQVACKKNMLKCNFENTHEPGSHYWLVVTVNGIRQLWILQTLSPNCWRYNLEKISTLVCAQAKKIKDTLRQLDAEFPRGSL